MNDLKFALRQLLKNPGFAAVAALTLAVGIGANTALFSVVHAVLVRPLPFGDPERIVQVWGTRPAANNFRARTSLPNFLDFQAQSQSFAHLAYYRMADFHFTGTDNPAEVRVGRVSEKFFEVMGVMPLVGQQFMREENVPGRSDVVILSHGLWTRRFGADETLVGKTIGLEGKSYIVRGVMPPQFRFPERVDLWTPVAPSPELGWQKRNDHFYHVVGRLKDRCSLADAQTEVKLIAERLEKAYPEANDGAGCRLVPLPLDLVSDFKPALMLLLGAVAAVLLIACANVANLQLVRGLARRKEMAVRSAVGAARGQLIRQLLGESIVLALLAGVLGIVIADLGLKGILAIAPQDVPRIQEARLDGGVLLASLVLTTFTGVLFGIIPALASSRPNLVEQLKEGGRSSTDGSGRSRSRHWLVVGEIAVATVLLVIAGLLMQSFQNVAATPLGFRPENLWTVRVTLPWNKYHEAGKERLFFRTLLDRIRSRPGAEQTALVCALPIADRQTTVWYKEIGMPYEPGREPTAGFNYVTPSYLQTMGIPLLRGRNLDDHDTATSRRVVVVDESLAARLSPGADPIGRRVLIEGQGDEPFLIVGIAGQVYQRGALLGPRPQLYMHYQQINECSMWVVTRATIPLQGFERMVRAEVQSLDADQSTGPTSTMEQHLGEYSRLAQFRTLLTQVLAGLALMLAIVGIYGVIAFSASQRRREFGLRVALGATRGNLLRLVMCLGGQLAILGVTFGVLVALGTTHLLKDMLFELTPYDWKSFGIVAVLLLGTSLLASYLPARRASKIEPMEALRHE